MVYTFWMGKEMGPGNGGFKKNEGLKMSLAGVWRGGGCMQNYVEMILHVDQNGLILNLTEIINVLYVSSVNWVMLYAFVILLL